jgi:glutathione S-transferase
MRPDLGANGVAPGRPRRIEFSATPPGDGDRGLATRIRAAWDVRSRPVREPNAEPHKSTLADVNTMTTYRLHYFPESGNSYKLALMLALCGESFEPIWTDFGGGVTRTREWRDKVNAMGEIPVLEDAGTRLTQTAPILLRLSERHGRFGGETDIERFEILRWLFWDNHKLTGYMATFRFLRAFTPSPDPTVLAFLHARIDDYLGILEAHLRDCPFVASDRPTVADLSMVGYLSFPKYESGYDLAATHPTVNGWLSRIAALPGWRAPYDLLPGKRLRCYVSDGGA